MLNKSLKNIVNENYIIDFAKSLKGVDTVTSLCFGDFNPITRKKCEIITACHENLNRHGFIGRSNPIIVVPLFKRKFLNNNDWESAMCCLSNHRLVNYVLDVESSSPTDVLDRFRSDFVFVDRLTGMGSELESFAKRCRIKLLMV